MSSTSASLVVDFTSNYTGGHRVCWKLSTDTVYDCNTIVNCPGAATACQAIINITVDPTSCDGPLIYEGYIQAVCEDISSLNGRLPFTVTFTPNPTCDRYTVTCSLSTVDTITVDNAGSGYDPASPPTITITETGAPPTTPATATTTVGAGLITSVVISDGGTGYPASSNWDVCVTDSASGTGAVINMVSDASGVIISASITNPGTGYQGPSANTTQISDCTTPISNITPAVLALTTDYGTITSITVTNVGADYDAIPTATIDPPTSGVTALVTVNMKDCVAFSPGNDCTGATLTDIVGLPFLVTWGMCIEDGSYVALPAGYTSINEGCCTANCIDYHIENTDLINPHNVMISMCNGGTVTESVPAGQTIARCAAQDGVHTLSDSNISVTSSGPCTA